MTAWTDLDGGVRVRQSRAYRMNSGLLLHPEHAIVVDGGVLPSELDDLAAAVAAARPARVTLLFTHGHWDHVLAKPWWPEAETVAHDRCAAVVQRDREKILREAGTLAEQHGERWTRGFEPFRPTTAVSGLHFTKIGPWRVVLRDAPGHSDSQLTLHLPEQRVLFAADMLSDVEIPILDGPAEVYRKTLAALVPAAEGGAIETLVPGHGAIARGRDQVLERFENDLVYLDALERGARAAAAEGLSLEQARERLAAMEYIGKDSVDQSTVEYHARNVAIEYQLAAAAGPQNGARAGRR